VSFDLTQVDTSRARLPSTYHAAKRAISQCASLDECKEWADKAAALASYAKQAQDDQLEKMAKRIRARATRRAGELLKQVDGRAGQNLPNAKPDAPVPISREKIAADVGLSRRQMKTATRQAQQSPGFCRQRAPVMGFSVSSEARSERAKVFSRSFRGGKCQRGSAQQLAGVSRSRSASAEARAPKSETSFASFMRVSSACAGSAASSASNARAVAVSSQ